MFHNHATWYILKEQIIFCHIKNSVICIVTYAEKCYMTLTSDMTYVCTDYATRHADCVTRHTLVLEIAFWQRSTCLINVFARTQD